MTEFILPWPPSILSPNNRQHWGSKVKVRAKCRADGALLTQLAMMKSQERLPTGNIPMKLIFHPPTKRQPDLDNLLASMKNYLDGVADALGVNDKCFQPITCEYGEPRKRGEVVVRI